MYDRGYRTWTALWETAAADQQLPQDQLDSLYSAFPNIPYFPRCLAVERCYSNTAVVQGRSTWTATRGPCDLPPFQEEVVVQVASNCPTTVIFVSDPSRTKNFPSCFARESDHFVVLVLAWAYILTARWAELVPGASAPEYSNHQPPLDAGSKSKDAEADSNSVVVDIGDVDDVAAAWWTAVLAADGGWTASIRNNAGVPLYSPWSIKTQPGTTFVISANVQPHPNIANHSPASFDTAV